MCFGIVVVQVNACRRKDVAAGEAEEDRLRKRANRALWTGWQVPYQPYLGPYLGPYLLWTGWQVRDKKRVVWVTAIAVCPPA